MYGTITVEQDGALVTVLLNRPEVRNAFNAQMIAELTEAFAALAVAPDVRVVVLRGAGPVFSGGADVQWMRASLDLGEAENRADALRMAAMFHVMNSLPQPLLGSVHGAALGGGMGLLACCDVVVAEETATFGFTEVKLGIIPAVISAVVVPKIGQSWARALFVTGERFGTEVARRIGLVHWIAPTGELEAVARSRIDEMVSSGPQATRAAKELVAWFDRLDRDDAHEFTAGRIAALRTGAEGQEGLRAFLEKRRPAWRANGE